MTRHREHDEDMTDQEFIELLRTRAQAIARLVDRVLPVKLGAMAKSHFQQNFRLQGFMDEGLHAWPATRRQEAGGKGAGARYGALLSGRNRLYGSIGYRPGRGMVTVGTGVPYAAIHNDGGTVRPRVTARMRAFAWAMYYRSLGAKAAKHGGHGNAGGKKGKKGGKQAAQASPEAERWKALALTRKQQLTIAIPKRPFIGDSRELRAAIGEKIQAELDRLFEN